MKKNNSVVSCWSLVVSKKILRDLVVLVVFVVLGFHLAFAKDITVLYTGETHAMLYPCDCPREPDGGVSRRAALVKILRKANADTLVLDSGGFFAGGLMDEYTQNAELDMRRTEINLKAIKAIGYDAVAVGDDEFNFGRQFLEKNASSDKPAFLSANLKSDKTLPYIIKEASGLKIGITALTPVFASSKAGGLQITEPKEALKAVVQELKGKNAAIIILLSHLGENEDLNLISDVDGIDVVVVGQNRIKDEPSAKIGSTILVRPSWQGRRLGKLDLKVEGNKITDYKIEELRLSDSIKDDTQVTSFLPVCFSDLNCKKEGVSGACQNPGAGNAACVFSPAAKVGLSVVLPKACVACDTQKAIKFLKGFFPGLRASSFYYPGQKAEELIKKFKLTTLPAYILDKDPAEKEKGFASLRENLELREGSYVLKPQLSGIAYFLDRRREKGRFDVFVSLHAKGIQELLEAVKDFNPALHFLVVEDGQGGFSAAGGAAEAEECLRSVCVNKYYPQYFWSYISCRAKNINSSWWQDCLFEADLAQIKKCAQGEEGRSLLKENIRLNRELGINAAPAYLLDNRNIFSSRTSPNKQELKKIVATLEKQ